MGEPFYKPNRQPDPARQREPGVLLFEFDQADHTLTRCEFRNNGQYGWEAQFLVRADLFYAHGAFPTSAAAVRWAEEERKALEANGGSSEML